MAESTQCPNIEQCPMFQYFKEYAKKVYQNMYCLGEYTTCERYKLKAAGKPVPENLLPHGGTLWNR